MSVFTVISVFVKFLRRLTSFGGVFFALFLCIMSQHVHAFKAHSGKDGSGKGGGEKIVIAMLLPFSGQYSQMADSLFDASILATADLGADNFIILPVDTGETAEKAVKAAKLAVEYGADVVIGPVFGQLTSAVVPVLRAANIPLFSMSNDSSLIGKGAYVAGFLIEQQVRRAFNFAASEGRDRVTALLPNKPVGIIAETELRKAALAKNLSLMNVEYFSPDLSDVKRTVERLVKNSMPIVPEKASSFAGQKSSVYSKQKSANALIVISNTAELIPISKALEDYGVFSRDVMVVGTNMWDDERIFANARMTGSYFAGPAPGLYEQFQSYFRNYFSYEPTRLSTVAYDMTSLMIYLHKNKMGFSEESITDKGGFDGIDGPFRFRRDGLIERDLAIIKVGSAMFELASQPALK